MDDEMCQTWNSNKKLQKWKNSMKLQQDADFEDLKDILLSETKDISQIVGEALRTTPKLFSEYTWYLATDFSSVPEETNQIQQSIEILELLGEGNYGKVSKCYYTDGSGKRFLAACKKCNSKRGGNDIFNREIQTLRQLNHLFVIKYLDVVEKLSKRYIVMELCEGSLKEYVDGKLDGIPKDSLDEKILVSQMALGLAYIHDKGIIHKDLKLENILLKRQSPRLVLAKIADFGFAKELKPGNAEFSETSHPGTEKYMAPELLNAPDGSYPASFASDVYALGITIARIVKKGDHPFSLDNLWRMASMSKGLVPPNLQEFSWDLIDLIIKLTDKDPGKRPEMALVLRHPYFVLTNDRTKRYFIDQLCNDIELLSNEDRTKQLTKIFNDRNFQEWYDTVSGNKPVTAEEIAEMAKNLSHFRKYKPDIQVDTLYPGKEYADKIKEAITSDYEAHIESQINQMSSDQNLSRYRLYKLVQQAPNLLVPYIWSHLLDLVNNRTKLMRTIKNQKNIQQKQRAVRTRRQSSKTKPFTENTILISEIEWSSLYYDENELVDELWNTRYYLEQVENSSEMSREIIGIAAKCNVTVKVWTTLLDRFGRKGAEALLHEIVKSNAYNGPEITQLILRRYGASFDDKISLTLAASNEGDWATDITKVILEHGRDPNAPNPTTGLTPIHYAAKNESHSGPEIMKLILEHGGDPNVRSTHDGSTPVHWAAANQGDYAPEILKLILESGGTCDMREFVYNFEPIHFATINIGKSAPELLDLLLKIRGSKVTFGCRGISLVHVAMFNNGDYVSNILKILFENGAKPDACDKIKQTPLHLLAASNKHKNNETSIMEILMRNGANPNAVDDLGETPVHFAAANEEENAYETLKFLLGNGGNLKTKNNDGITPIHCALLNTGTDGSKMRQLVGVNEENINGRLNKNGETLLHYVINRIETAADLVQLILDHGGNPNIKDKLGRSPVHVAVVNELSDSTILLQMLLLKGGNPNLPDKEFRASPVHYVASSLRDIAPNEMKILLEHGGDANNIDKNKRTPLHLAAGNEGLNGCNLTRILLEHQGNPNAVDVHKRTPLHLAVHNQNEQLRIDIISQLLENGGNPNAGDSKGWTPVHFAVCDKRSNSLKVLKLLLQYGGNIHKCDDNEMTPFLFATRSGSKKYCLAAVKTYLLKMSRQITRNDSEIGNREKIRQKFTKIINLFKQVPVVLVLAIFPVLFIYILFFLWPIFFK